MKPTVQGVSVVEKIKDVVLDNHKFYVLTHERPDGDAIGSGLAMTLALSKLGKKVFFVLGDSFPPAFNFLPKENLLVNVGALNRLDLRPDVTIFVDCTGEDRPGDLGDFALGETWVNIDHHVSNSYFGHLNYVDPSASAAGELVYNVIRALGVGISPDIASCIYVAVVTDTGGFRYQNTSSGTHRLAADLLEKGVDAHRISEAIFENRSSASVLLIGSALKGLKLSFNDKVSSIVVTQKMMDEVGASLEDAEDIINYPRSISGVEIALVFKEIGDKIHVSMRSKSDVDVAAIAVSLGGGGHPKASGAVLCGDLKSVQEKVFSEIRKVMC